MGSSHVGGRRPPTRSAPARGAHPLYEPIRAQVLAAERIHGDETPVPVLGQGPLPDGADFRFSACRGT
jgi:Transposase IS66 family